MYLQGGVPIDRTNENEWGADIYSGNESIPVLNSSKAKQRKMKQKTQHVIPATANYTPNTIELEEEPTEVVPEHLQCGHCGEVLFLAHCLRDFIQRRPLVHVPSLFCRVR